MEHGVWGKEHANIKPQIPFTYFTALITYYFCTRIRIIHNVHYKKDY